MNVRKLSSWATTVLVVAVLSLLFRHSLFAHKAFPIALQVMAAMLMLWARLTFGWRSFSSVASPSPGGLVTTGPYRWIRHPIYTAILLFMWTGVAAQGSLLSLLTAIVGTAATVVRIASEENLIVDLYPEYVAYARRTKRLIPFLL